MTTAEEENLLAIMTEIKKKDLQRGAMIKTIEEIPSLADAMIETTEEAPSLATDKDPHHHPNGRDRFLLTAKE